MAKRKLPVVTFADPDKALDALKGMLGWIPERPSKLAFGLNRDLKKKVLSVVAKRKPLTKKRKKR